MHRGELGELQFAERGCQVVADNLAIPFVAFRRHFHTHGIEPRAKPFLHGDPGRIELPRVERAQEPPQFLLGVLAGAADRRGRHLSLAGRGIGAEAVAQLERAGRPLANVSGTTHLSFSLASFAAVESDPVRVRTEFGVGSSTCAYPRLKPITAMSALSNGGTARKFLGEL